jgi:RHS repeat-associated protein
MEMWKTLRVSHIPTPPTTTTDNCPTKRYTNIPLGTKDRSGHGHVATIDTNTITYDANGNKVEENVGGTIHEYVSAFGVTAQMTGSTENATNIDLPGGVQALYSGGTLQRFRFPDWQGTMRAESNPSTRLFTESLAFAPFGERYALKGAPYNVDSFTGKPDQIVTDEYDFPAREEHNGQGRWISPDPTRGTGNKYVYAANNPLRYVDPYGLWINDAFLPEGANMDLGGEGENELAESHPFVSAQTGGQVKASSSGNSSSSSTQTPAAHQEAQKDASAKAGEPAKQAQNSDTTTKANVVYGETSGLSPEKGKDGKADPNSANQLKEARENIADISERNKTVHSHHPSKKELKNPSAREAWERSKEAARASDGSKPGRYFFIRQDEVGRQKPRESAGFGQGDPIHEYGPFNNAGGGDVPRGSQTYVDIYDK